MSARLAAEIAALSRVAEFLGKQLLKEAGDAGELREKVAALQAEVAELKKPTPFATDVSFTGGSSGLSDQEINNYASLNQGDWLGS